MQARGFQREKSTRKHNLRLPQSRPFPEKEPKNKVFGAGVALVPQADGRLVEELNSSSAGSRSRFAILERGRRSLLCLLWIYVDN